MDISIIIPLYKGTKYIRCWMEMIENNMRYFHESKAPVAYEVIFVNDYPDEPIQIKDIYPNSDNLKVFNLPENRGIHGARVFGYYQARGEYIVFFDQDDRITDDYFLSQLPYVKHGDAVVCDGYMERFCMSVRTAIYGTEEAHKKILSLTTYIRQNGVIISPGQVVMRKDAIPEVWLKNIMKINGADDLLLWMTMLSSGRKFVINRERLYVHVGNGKNTSADEANMFCSVQEAMHIAEVNHVLDDEEINMLLEKAKGVAESSKYRKMMLLYDYWMHLKICNMSVAQYFEDKGYRKVAVYGMNYVGSRLCDELKESSVKVMFGIDKNAKRQKYEVSIYEPEEVKQSIGEVDAIVVTVITGFEKVKNIIQKEFDIPIISISDVIIELCEQLEDVKAKREMT